MFGSTKVKIAAGLATGALTLGAAGAYAAANNNNTVSTANAKPVTLTLPTGATTPTFHLISLSGNTALSLTAFKNKGECVSTFAKNKDLALAPAGSSKLSKNFHGKLMSTVQSWCKQFNTKNADTQTADATETQTTDTTSSTDSTSSTDAASSTHGQSGKSHGHGHGRGSAND